MQRETKPLLRKSQGAISRYLKIPASHYLKLLPKHDRGNANVPRASFRETRFPMHARRVGQIAIGILRFAHCYVNFADRRPLITSHQFRRRRRRRYRRRSASPTLSRDVFEGARQFTGISSLAMGMRTFAKEFSGVGTRRALAFPLPLPSSWVPSTGISVVAPTMEPRMYTARDAA